MLGADTYLPEVGKSLTLNILPLKITPSASQLLTNSKFKLFFIF